jgi:excisionase family DNA binding protein
MFPGNLTTVQVCPQNTIGQAVSAMWQTRPAFLSWQTADFEGIESSVGRRMVVNSNKDLELERIVEALKNPDNHVQAVLARWQDHDFTVRVNGKWRLEGFINFFQSVQELVAAVDGTTPPGLPPQCLDPVQIARFFRIPLDEFAASGIPVGESREQPLEMLTIGRVADLLGCSYGEARNRMLEGRIRAVKDGRWCRSRREWVEEYIERQTVRAELPQPVEVPVPQAKRKPAVSVKAGGVAHMFLQNRKG